MAENNTLLRALQYIAAESIAYGRFCWNDECGNCEVQCVVPESGEVVVVRACQKVVYKGMKITSLSDDVLLDLD